MNRRARYRKDVSPTLPLRLTQRGIVVICVLLFLTAAALSTVFSLARESAQAAIFRTAQPTVASTSAPQPVPETAAASSSSHPESAAPNPTESATTDSQAHSEEGPQSTFDVTKIKTSEDPLLVMVRKDLPLEPADFKPKDLVSLAPGKTLTQEAAAQFKVLLSDAAKAGHSLRIESGYRSYNAQANLFKRYAQKYGETYAAKISARPGTSEHQTGLAADIGLSNGQCSLHRCFGDIAAGKWVAENATHYGFIIRYPSDKVSVTGYNFEPWHLRYIGLEQAKAYKDSGAGSLEEFVAGR